MDSSLIFSREVQSARAAGRPIVALESTLITHGLPRPVNAETARLLEDEVREAGAVPATIAVLAGHPCIGLSPEQLDELANADGVRKCSRRDLPIVMARGEHGATTVAATMLLAYRAGIRVFATGGIGGVHRGHPQDVSADLEEFALSPVAVVCAGAKSILDLPLTLEYLETHGVPVLGYGTDRFPAFYSRDSGLPVDVRCDTPEAVAVILHARDRLQLPQGVVVAVPVPVEYELPKREADVAIERALAEADVAGIRGKETTPFLLARVSELTDARSRAANVALLRQNARLAAQIAVADVRLRAGSKDG